MSPNFILNKMNIGYKYSKVNIGYKYSESILPAGRKWLKQRGQNSPKPPLAPAQAGAQVCLFVSSPTRHFYTTTEFPKMLRNGIFHHGKPTSIMGKKILKDYGRELLNIYF